MLNKITIHGYLGRDPELKEMQGQSGPYKRVTFSVAVSRDFGDETDWFFVSMNGKRAEVVNKFFRKGSEIIVSGRMESYKPKKNPETTAWVLRADGFDFVGKKEKSDVPEGFHEIEDDEDDGNIPF